MARAHKAKKSRPIPLVVDLDDSLIKIDVLAEWTIRLLLQKPFKLLKIVIGESNLLTFKRQVAQSFSLREDLIPRNQEVLNLIKDRQLRGGEVYLATASLPSIAIPIALANQINDVFASDNTNLKGEVKRDKLIERFGDSGFDYVGNAYADIPVWNAAKEKFFAGSSRDFKRISRLMGLELVDLSRKQTWKSILGSLRPTHWVKNLLLAVPVVLAGEFALILTAPLLSAVIGFSFVASGLYLVNDILDVDADRAHPAKRFRPIANGELSALKALLLAAALVASGLLTSFFGAGLTGFLTTLAYGLGSLLYSLKVKTIPYLDVLGLAGLYVFRIIAGALVTDTFVSYWMMLFALMTFSALASLKRVTELTTGDAVNQESMLRSSRREYRPEDLPIIRSLGAAFTVGSIALLGIYAQETFTSELQSVASLLLVSSFAVWMLRFWLDLSRGRLGHDPIKHALSDRASLIILTVTFGIYFWLSWSF